MRDRESQENPFVTYFPPGHYYSPLPDLTDICARKEQIWQSGVSNFPGIELRLDEQMKLLEKVAERAVDYPFPAQPSQEFRYHYENDFFPLTDGTIYHALLRYWRPSQVVEIGSGFSSALLLDTRDHFLESDTTCTFIEPDTSRLRSLLRPADGDVRIIESRLQECEEDIFGLLRAGDILFVDSSHVSKVGSDVNEIVFNVLPRLQAGVYVHFHDIYYPFEYPLSWLEKGWAWNEAYLLRAFLQFNDAFEVVLWNRFITTALYESIPEQLKKLLLPGTGGSIWLRKVK